MIRRLVRSLIFLFAVSLTFSAYGSPQPSILVVGSACSDHMAGPKLFLIDPVLEKKLQAKGHNIATAYYADINNELIRQFELVILLQEPVNVPEEKKYFDIYISKLPVIEDYVKNGGGLIVFFDERHYAHEWDFSINYCLELFGASAGHEAFLEADKANIHKFEMVPGQEAFRTGNIAKHPVTAGVEELWYPKMSRVINVDEQWNVIVRGEASSKTEKTYASAPPVVAVRDFGKGRVALFASLSSFYILNGYHRTYDEGWMFTRGDGELFFDNLFTWLSEKAIDAPGIGGYDGGSLSKSKEQLGTRIERIEATGKDKPQAGVIGVYTTFSGGQYSVADYARKGRKLGLDFIAFTDTIINEKQWKELEAECKAVSDEDFVAIPGVEFTTSWRGEIEGLKGFMVNGDKWPPIYGDTFISTKLRTSEQHSSIVVVANPRDNTLPPWNVGGFNALEIMSYQGDQQFSAALDWYKWYQAIPSVGWYPVVSHRVWNLDQLDDAVKEGYKNYIYAPDAMAVRDVPGEGLTPGFVSSGPVINKFRTDVIMRDPWEHYYLWTPGQKCRVEIDVESQDKLRSVELYSGKRVIRSFKPQAKKLKVDVETILSQEGSFYLEAFDAKGGCAYSYTIPTRNLNYWNHIGSDAMNDYHNPVNEDPFGDLLYEGKRYGYGGLVTFGYGWSNYIRYYHPVAVNEFHPLGYESGMIPAGIADIQTYPTVWYSNKGVHGNNELSNALPRRSCPVASADIAVIREDVDFVNDNGRAFESQYINSTATSTLYRYEYKPYGYIIMPVETQMKVKTAEGQKLDLISRDGLEVALLTITFQSNKHFNTLNRIGTDGQMISEPIDLSKPEAVSIFRIEGGSFVSLSPDPFGQTALFVTEGTYDVEITGGERPVMRIGYDTNGGTLNDGQQFDGHFIVLQEGGGQGVDICRELYDKWGLDGSCDYTPRMLSGKIADNVYTVDMAADAGVYGVRARFDKIEELPNGLLPAAVEGVNDNWTVAALWNDGYYPAAVADGRMYVGLRMPVEGEYFLGNPLIADNERLVIEAVYSEGKVEAVIHNPTDSKVVSGVKANPLLAGILELAQQISLEAGETVTVRGKMN